MTTCVIIVSYKTGAILRACLAAVARAHGVDEIIIVDNGNEEAEIQCIDALVDQNDNVKLLRGQGNVGFAKACNLAAMRASSDVLVFLNPDVTLAHDAVDRLTGALAAAPPPAIVGGDLRDAQGRPDRGSRRERLTVWRAFVSASGLSRFERWNPALRDFNRHTDPTPEYAARVSCISGALFAMRRSDFHAVGGFDEAYFMHFDDIDLCRRAEERGWPVLFLPGPHGVHERSSSKVNGSVVTAHKLRGLARYFQKFGGNALERGVASTFGAVLSFTAPRP